MKRKSEEIPWIYSEATPEEWRKYNQIAENNRLDYEKEQRRKKRIISTRSWIKEHAAELIFGIVGTAIAAYGIFN